jgi:ethanolamine transporter EutH
MSEGRQTFKDLLVGIVLFGILLLLLGIVWPGAKLNYYSGLAIGLIVAVAMVCDMYFSLERGLTMDAKQASHYFRKKVIVRLVYIIIALIIAILIKQIQILSVLFGILTLKFSAYLQPLTHKFLIKIIKGR